MIKLKYDTDLNLLIDTINVIKVKDNRYSFDKIISNGQFAIIKSINFFRKKMLSEFSKKLNFELIGVKMFKYLIDCFQKY